MVWFLELWVRSRNNIALPSPTDDTHLEFYFEQAGNIQRSFRGKKIMHRMLEMRPCQTGSRYIDGMQIHSQVFVYYCIYVTKIMSSKALYHIFFNNNL